MLSFRICLGTGLLGPPNPQSRYSLPQSNMMHNGTSNSPSVGPPTQMPPIPRSGGAIGPDLATLAETIVQATSIIQAAGLTAPHHPHSQPGESYDPSYCSVKLPAPQPLAPIDSQVLERSVNTFRNKALFTLMNESGLIMFRLQIICRVPSKSSSTICLEGYFWPIRKLN